MRLVINPDTVKAQFEGASSSDPALPFLARSRRSVGRVEQDNFNNYLVARLNEAPLETHAHLVENDEALLTGTGEPGIPPMSPAIYSAIFAATGKRFRELPLRTQKLV